MISKETFCVALSLIKEQKATDKQFSKALSEVGDGHFLFGVNNKYLEALLMIDENVILGECIIDLTKIDWDKKAEAIEQKKSQENMFCKNFITYLDNNLEQLKICCKKAHLTPNTFEKICNGTFSPTKPCVCNLIIAAKLNFGQATELLKSANISCYQFNKFDVVMAFFFENEIYDFNIINTTLYLLDLPMLGYYYV